MVVHRVVPGFVVQFGSPTADGYGGAPERAPLPCETSPLHFGPLSVGVALSGRDTGSSQIFVTLGSFPHLDGRYAWLGTATGPWAALAEGDLIREVRVSAKAAR
jgi:cyclophilin family peptidyl-prolyl cis-trans isomerase